MKYDLNRQTQAEAAFGHLQSLLEQGKTIVISSSGSDEKIYPQRTGTQNRALHKMFGTLADELNERGLTILKTLKPSVEIPWNSTTIKELIWRPIQKAQLNKKSTTELTTIEIDQVFDTITKHLGEKFRIELEFPSIESLIRKQEVNDD